MHEADPEEKVCLITGANTGIGRVTALELARRGMRVILACRSEGKSRPVVEEIRRETGNERVELLLLDLSELASVRRAAEEFLARETPLHILINNAGLAGQRGVTKDGFELAFGVNHLGHYLLTNLLEGRLRESAPARVVNVASRAHRRPRSIDWEALQRPTASFSGMKEYGVSKLANVLFSSELSRRLEGSGVTTYALHPGVIASDIWRRVPPPFRNLAKLFMKSNEEGAQTSLYCATSEEVADESGFYYEDCRKTQASRTARDAALAAELWQRSERWSGLQGA